MVHSPGGAIVFDGDGSVRQVTGPAAKLLDTTADALFEGTALPTSPPSIEGSECTSLRSVVDDVLRGQTDAQSIERDDGLCIDIRPTQTRNGSPGAVAILYPATDTQASDDLSPSLRRTQTRLLKRMASGASLSSVLDELVASIEAIRPGMLGSILIYNQETGTLRHGAAPNLPVAYVDAINGEKVGPRAGSCGTAVHTDKTIITEDIDVDERWARYKDVALAHDLRACWSTPIHGDENEILGTFALYYAEPRAPSSTDLSLIEEASSLASIAIEHERRKRKMALQRDQIRRLVENAQPAVFFLDDEGTVLIAEGQDVKSLDHEPQDMVGTSVYELFADHVALLDHIDRALAGQRVDAVVDVNGVKYDAWFAPYFDHTGSVAGCIGMAVDITDEHAAEEEIRRHRDVLRRTQKVAHVGGWEYNLTTDQMRGTEETYRICEVPLDADLSLEQALGLYPPDTASKIREAALQCLEEGIPFDEEGPLITPKGTRRWVRIRGEPRWSGDQVARMVGSVQDLTERHKIEERLREQKQWLQSITDNIAGGIYRSTDEGLVYANQALLNMFGYDTLEEMASLDAKQIYANPDVEEPLRRREKDGGGLNGVEVEYRRKDGSTFIGLLRSTRVRGVNDGVQYYDGVITDITEQKVREEKIRQQWQNIQSLYAPADLLLSADSTDEVGRRVVDLVRETFEYPGVIVHYHDDTDLVPCKIPPDKRTPLLENVSISETSTALPATVFREGQSELIDDVKDLEDDLAYEEYRSIASFPLGTFGVLTVASREVRGIDPVDLPLLDVLAQKAGAILARIDRKEELQASEQRFRGLFEEATLGIALVDRNGMIDEVNPAFVRMFGRQAEELRGHPLSSLSHPADTPREDVLVDAILRGEQTRSEREKRYLRRGGETFWGHLTVSRHHGPGRAEVLALIEDISERKQYEQKLQRAKQKAEEASRLKSNMLANMSHEIRTPLTSIIGFADTLRNQLSGSDAHYAELIQESGQRLMSTLDSVLQLSKLEAGSTSPATEPVDLVAIAEETVALYEADARGGQIDLILETHAPELTGTWDSTVVQRILSNLVSNALKFTPGGGTVTVVIRPEGDDAVLEVNDTGIGISESFRPKLFKAFTQESEGRTREHGGTGLGLAIVKRLVDLVGGQIEVESTKGKGTCFTVRFPRELRSLG